MKKQTRGLLLASMLALVATGCATTGHSTAWKYKVEVASTNVFVSKNVSAVEDTINRMTQQGWKFVSATDNGDRNVVLIFKKHE